MGRLAESIGENIRYHRKLAGLTQKAFARRISVDPKSLSRIETGKRLPGLDLLARVARQVGVDLWQLVDIDRVMTRKLAEMETFGAIDRLVPKDRVLVLEVTRLLVERLASGAR